MFNDAIAMLIDSNGQLGTMSSSCRFKAAIKDPTPQFGLVAEEVAEGNSDLVIYDADGKPYTLRYDAVNAMLLNEFLKEHRTVREQQKEIDTLKAELKEQKLLIQKVSGQLAAATSSRGELETSEAAPPTVLNNR